MALYIPAKDDWARVFENVGKGVSEGYQQGADQRALQKAISSLPPDATPRQIIDSLTGARTYNDAAKQDAIKNYMGAAEFEQKGKEHKATLEKQAVKDRQADERAAERNRILQVRNDLAAGKNLKTQQNADQARQNVKGIVNQLNIPPDQKQALGESLSQSGAENLLKEQLHPKESTFEKGYGTKLAEQYAKVDEEIPKLQDNLATIDAARKLSNSLASNFIKGSGNRALSALGLSGGSKELESMTFPLIEPILHMLAPSGTIAREKLLRAEAKYAISGTDAPWNREAKLRALEGFTKQALVRAQKKKELIERYRGEPPTSMMERFNRESDTISDAMLDYDLVGEEVDIPGMPPAAQYKGEEYDAPDGGVIYSDGMRWIKK